jgi:hypothetical protein
MASAQQYCLSDTGAGKSTNELSLNVLLREAGMKSRAGN